MIHTTDRMIEHLYNDLWEAAGDHVRDCEQECERRSGIVRFDWLRFDLQIDDPHLEYLLNRLTEVRRTQYWYIALPGHDPYYGYRIFDTYWLSRYPEDDFRPVALASARYRWEHPQQRKETPSTHGYVYLFKAGEYYKIGASIQPDVRKMQLQIQLPFEIEKVHWFECENYMQAEDDLHRKFIRQRLNGEWFNLTPEDVRWIKSIKSDADLQGLRPRIPHQH